MHCKKKFVEKFLARVWAERDYSEINKYISNNTIVDSPIAKAIGPSWLESVIGKWHTAFPSLSKVSEEVFYDKENRMVITRFVCKGKHDGDFIGIPPSGIDIQYMGTGFYKFDPVLDDKIVEYKAVVNTLDVLKSHNLLRPSLVQTPTVNILQTIQEKLSVYNVSKKEIIVLAHWLASVSYNEIAKILSVSPKTIDSHVSNVKQKLAVSSKAEVVNFLHEHELFYLFTCLFGKDKR